MTRWLVITATALLALDAGATAADEAGPKPVPVMPQAKARGVPWPCLRPFMSWLGAPANETMAIGGPFGYRLANASRAASSCRGSRSVATYRAGRKPSTRRAASNGMRTPCW